LPQSEKKWSSDRELVEAILGGSREHFELLYEAYFSRVYRFALKRLGDPGDAEDVAQEVFFTVFNSLHSYQGTAPLLIWIFGITRNTVNRRFRRVRPRMESIDTGNAAEIPAFEAPTDQAVVRGGHRERSDTPPTPYLPPEAPQAAIHPQHCGSAGQVRGCHQGEPLPHASGHRAERPRSRKHSGRGALTSQP
jgi:RNA polymerase sigma factor (sigma-70 family)